MKSNLLLAAFLLAVMQGFTQEKAPDSAQTRIMMLDTLSKPVKLDIKTGIGDKEKSKLAKAGLVAYLRQSDWGEVVNLGEDFAVWVENLQRKLRGNSILFQLDLELRSRADFGVGKLLATRHIADTVDMAEFMELKTFQERELFRLIEKKLSSRVSLKSLVATVAGGAAKIGLPGPGGLIQGGMSHLGGSMGRKCTDDEIVEGMVLGATLVTHTKEMLNEVMTMEKR